MTDDDDEDLAPTPPGGKKPRRKRVPIAERTKPRKRITNEELSEIGVIAHGQNDPVLEAVDPYYDPSFGEDIVEWAQEITFPETWAARLGVTEVVMFSWVQRYPEFARDYLNALTHLRAKWSEAMVGLALGRKGDNHSLAFANPKLVETIARQRFADLYGKADTAAPGLTPPAAPRDITPTEGEISDVAPNGMTPEQIERELSDLRILRERHK